MHCINAAGNLMTRKYCNAEDNFAPEMLISTVRGNASEDVDTLQQSLQVAASTVLVAGSPSER